jgi:hypothetical protein
MGLIPIRDRLSATVSACHDIIMELASYALGTITVGGDSLFIGAHEVTDPPGWGNRPAWIHPKLLLRCSSQNLQGIIPKEKDPQISSGTDNIMIKLPMGIVGLTETNADWHNYTNRDQYASAYKGMAST